MAHGTGLIGHGPVPCQALVAGLRWTGGGGGHVFRCWRQQVFVAMLRIHRPFSKRRCKSHGSHGLRVFHLVSTRPSQQHSDGTGGRCRGVTPPPPPHTPTCNVHAREAPDTHPRPTWQHSTRTRQPSKLHIIPYRVNCRALFALLLQFGFWGHYLFAMRNGAMFLVWVPNGRVQAPTSAVSRRLWMVRWFFSLRRAFRLSDNETETGRGG